MQVLQKFQNLNGYHTVIVLLGKLSSRRRWETTTYSANVWMWECIMKWPRPVQIHRTNEA